LTRRRRRRRRRRPALWGEEESNLCSYLLLHLCHRRA
jgi:hypothetical protein